jgi:hypothetical protein
VSNTSVRTRAPVPLLGAAVVVLLEGLLTAVLGVIVGVRAFRGDGSLVAGEFMAGCGVLVGVGLGVVARGLTRHRRWSRAPALVAQIICVPVAITLAQGGRYAAGIPLLVVAVLCVLALFTSASTKAFDED